MNKTLHNHVTSQAFNLSLSKGQINALCYVVNEDENSLVEDGRAVTYLSALLRRGLVYHRNPDNMMEFINSGQKAWTPTKAGKIVYQLLCEAGLINEPDKVKSKEVELA